MHKGSVDTLGELPLLFKDMVAAAASWTLICRARTVTALHCFKTALPGTAPAYPEMLFKDLFICLLIKRSPHGVCSGRYTCKSLLYVIKHTGLPGGRTDFQDVSCTINWKWESLWP